MILYFSATGNSKYVAERIAAALGDQAVSLLEATEADCKNAVGLVSPTYAAGIPSVVADFLKDRRLRKKSDYLFFVATYGTTPGRCDLVANRILSANSGIEFDACFGVRMPDTWTPVFDLSNKDRLAAINQNAERQIDSIIEMIAKKRHGIFLKLKLPGFVRLIHRPFYDHLRQTKNFHVEAGCIGCGLCAKQCPTGTIVMHDGMPRWETDTCAMCLGCLHRCPVFAIQYGKNTKKHGQYHHPNTTL